MPPKFGSVSEWRQSVDGRLHFSLRMDRLVPLDAFWLDEVHEPMNLIGNRFANVLTGYRTAAGYVRVIPSSFQ